MTGFLAWCWLFGHKWGPWEVQGPNDPEPYESRFWEGCTRCDAVRDKRRREP